MTCPLCRGDDSVVAHEGVFFLREEPVRQETRVCRACGLTFERSKPDQDWAGLYGDVWQRGTLPSAGHEGLYANDGRVIGPPDGGRRRAFEVGCGSGLLLDELADLGWDTAGCDPEAAAIAEASRKGHAAHAELFTPRDGFVADLVVLGDVLEHQAEPLALLRDARAILHPEGRLYLRVPDLEKVDFDTFGDVFGLQHRVWFTRETLREMLGVAGFAVSFTGTYARGMHAMTRPCEPSGWARPEGEPERSLEIVRAYSREMEARRERIAERLVALAGRAVALYGGGEHAEELLRFSPLGRIASRVVDGNRELWGRSCGGLLVEPPEALRADPPESIVIASKAYQDEIAAELMDLAERGVEVVRLYTESG